MARRRKKRKGILRSGFNILGSIGFLFTGTLFHLVKNVNKERKY